MEREVMDFAEFKEALVSAMKERFDAEIEETVVKKNNGVSWQAIIIKEKEINISPTFYVEQLYYQHTERGMSLETIVEYIEESYNRSRMYESVDLSQITEWDNIKDKIQLRLVNYRLNEDMLKDVPHIKIMDLAILFYIPFDKIGDIEATVLVNKRLMETYEKTEYDLYENALCQMEAPMVLSMSDMLKIVMEEDFDCESFNIEEDKMYVLTNARKQHGAALMLNKENLKRIAEEKGLMKFYILPSSVHEVLIVPENESELEKLRDMVNTVNIENVLPEEILSDKVYIYDYLTNEIRIA